MMVLLKSLKKKGADVTALCDFTIDLTSDDGLKDYGNSTNKVNLLTCDMYRKYRHLIPNLYNCWWLATAYSTKSNGYETLVRSVYTDGTLSNTVSYYSRISVRPAFLIKSSIFESRNQDLSSFTTEELLREVLLRNANDK